MGPVKRICVFEHSVMTNFNCACPAIQRGQGFGFLSEGSSWFTACLSEQKRSFDRTTSQWCLFASACISNIFIKSACRLDMVLKSFFGWVIHYENKMVETCRSLGLWSIPETNRIANASFTDEIEYYLPKNRLSCLSQKSGTNLNCITLYMVICVTGVCAWCRMVRPVIPPAKLRRFC